MRSVLFLCVASLLLSSCARRIDFGPQGPIEDPARILAIVESHQQRITGIVGGGRLSVDAPQGSGTLRIAIEVAKPSSVYLETADILGFARGTFATDGREIAFYDPGENLFITGPADPETIGSLLPVAMGPDEMVAALLGQIPFIEEPDSIELRVEDEGVYRIDLVKGWARQRIRVGTRDLRLVSVRSQGLDLPDAELSRHVTILDNVPFARTITLRTPDGKTELRIRYGDLEFNPSHEPESFRLFPPPGARIERL